MKRFIVVMSLCILASSPLALAHPAYADVRISANLNSGRVYLDSEPNVVLVPGTQVYYAPNGSYDVYQYRNRWYVSRNGTWYRSSNYRSAFVEIPYERVPRQVLAVPDDYRQQMRRNNGWNGWHNRNRHYHRDWNNDNSNSNDNNDYRHHN